MASYYRKIDIRIHGDEKFRSLSRPQPNGQSLFTYLLTNPHTTNIPGIFRASLAILADDLGWDTGSLREAFREVSDKGMAVADWEARVIYIPNAVRYNPPASVNVVKSWVTALDLVPESPLKAIWVQRAWSFLCNEFRPVRGEGQAYLDAFREAFAVVHPEAFAKPSGSLPVGIAYQDQDQDQDLKTKRGTPELHREGELVDNSPDIPNSKNEPGTGSGFTPPPPDAPDAPDAPDDAKTSQDDQPHQPKPERATPAKRGASRTAKAQTRQTAVQMIRAMAAERDVPWPEVLERAGGEPPWKPATITDLKAWLMPMPKFSEAELDQRRRSRRAAEARAGPRSGPRPIGDVLENFSFGKEASP